jgi:hypothetical protein
MSTLAGRREQRYESNRHVSWLQSCGHHSFHVIDNCHKLLIPFFCCNVQPPIYWNRVRRMIQGCLDIFGTIALVALVME